MLRTRWLISTVALLAMVVMALVNTSFVPVALADSNRPQTYLALGDSVAFGFNPLVSPSDASNFIGYPTPVSDVLKESLTNAACPGETSSHFISLSGSDNGCGGFRSKFPLHVDYSTSQLAYADTFLRSHPKTLVVSINIGSNDLFVLVRNCGGEQNVKCIVDGLPAMLATLSANLDIIYGHIRNLDGYHHKIVALTYYTTNFSDPLGTGIISQVNQVVTERTLAWKGIVADGFAAFKAATAAFGGNTCAAGLLIVTSQSPLTCDIHPSEAGRELLAETIVNTLRAD